MSKDLSNCLDRALAALLTRRNHAGYWEGRLASSPLATAVALCALDENDISAERRRNSHDYLAKTQNSDGGWGDTEISKSNLAASLLTLCADALQPFLSNDARARANAYVEKLGGVGEGLSRVYGKDLTFQVPIRMCAAFAGLKTERGEPFDWRDVDALPFELALAPRSLMGALRLPVVSYALPALVCVGLSRHAKAPSWMLPLRWLRSSLTEKALAAILKMQPKSGGYLEAIPITAFCRIGLKAAGRGDHPVAQNARRFLIDTQRDDGSWPVEVHLSVWNTTRAIDALAAGGLLESALSEQERATTRDWLLAQQCRERSVYSDTQPGGWGWNHLSGSVPDADDTAGAVIALRHMGLDSGSQSFAMARAWFIGVRNLDGGWPTFCRGWNKLPFDRSAPDLTAHALRALLPRRVEEKLDAPAIPPGALVQPIRPWIENSFAYLKKSQNEDGSYSPLWFGCESAQDSANLTYGTSQVLIACAEWTKAQSSWLKIVKKVQGGAVNWLLRIQNPDGGFGGCAGAPSTAEETGLALRALVAQGYTLDDAQCQRAAQWLIEHQRADGSWDPAPIGFYFAVLWYYEELYPLVYAVGGLGALARTRQNVEAVTAA